MNAQQEQIIEMQLDKIAYYACYVDCFMRIITEFVEGGSENLNSNDIPNLCELSAKYTRRLYQIILESKRLWEFRQ